MERLAFLVPGDTVEPGDLAFIMSPAQESSGLLVVDQPLAAATDRFQVEYIRKAIQRAGDNMTDAAELLGLHRSNLYRKMKQLGMEGLRESAHGQNHFQKNHRPRNPGQDHLTKTISAWRFTMSRRKRRRTCW